MQLLDWFGEDHIGVMQPQAIGAFEQTGEAAAETAADDFFGVDTGGFGETECLPAPP